MRQWCPLAVGPCSGPCRDRAIDQRIFELIALQDFVARRIVSCGRRANVTHIVECHLIAAMATHLPANIPTDRLTDNRAQIAHVDVVSISILAILVDLQTASTTRCSVLGMRPVPLAI
ncbi:MAG: hypothetical protein CBB71_00985 [Rhodopirellula sp. TMED11]|nr:MAG: hypothetical protein CBB71_00985 [Rhodopirellula sp. TMED11]